MTKGLNMAKLEINLGNVTVDNYSQPYFIAEIGINHNGDMQIVKKLIDASFATNWDCVKFQKRTPEIAVPESQKNIIRSTPWGEMTYLEYKKKIELGKGEYDEIDRYCKEKPIAWTASPWDLPSLEFLLEYDVPFIKIASAMNQNDEIIRTIGKSGKPIVLSTGMSTWDEIDKSVDLLEKYTDGNYILLHTNSVYPTPTDQLNLRMIQSLKNRYHCLVGYSGHEENLEPTVIAAALGACIIERHVTLSHNMWGSDQKASLEVHAMDLLHKRINDIKLMLGDGDKKLSNEEMSKRMALRGN